MALRRERLAALGRRTRQVVVLAAVTGVLTGGAVAFFDWVVKGQLLDRLLDAPRAVQVGAPLAGLLLAAGILRWVGGGCSPSTADEYIQNFHDQGRRLPLRPEPMAAPR